MSVSTSKFIPSNLWLFAFLTVVWAQDVSNNSQIENVQFLPSGSMSPEPNATQAPAIVSEYIRFRRATSSESSSSCFAPPQPANGEWRLDRALCDYIDYCTIPEGTAIEPGIQLIYHCNPGYRATGNTDVYCRVQGNRRQWSPIPECVEVKCKSLNSVSTLVSCTRYGKWVNCDSSVPLQTRAEVSCRRGYKKDTDFITTRRSVVNCNANGEWEPLPITCVPVCGVSHTNQQPLILGGELAKVSEFPWHASIFVEKKLVSGFKKNFLCGATIIKTNLLLTAAHCVYDGSTQTPTDPRKLFVMTGNIFRDYDSPNHNPDIVRKATVKNVYTSCNYYGLTGNYVSDIGLLELQHPFEFSSILLPACLSDSGYSEQFLEPGVFGRVAGFGRTNTGVTSGVLQTLTVPYISYSQCKDSNNGIPNEAFISSDKFCAGYNNGSAVCEGDSGGGLVFKKGDLWHVMGIVSVGLGVNFENGEQTCDKYSYSLYTKVSTYMSWIQDVMFHMERNLQFPSCSRQSNPSVTRPTSRPTETYHTTQPIVPQPEPVTTKWDETKNPVSNVTPLHSPGSICTAPALPSHGTWRLHADFCKGNVTCYPSEGAVLDSGSVLIYECPWGIESDGNGDGHCGITGTRMLIAICSGLYESDCNCVGNELCFQTPITNPDGTFDGRFRFKRCIRSQDVCCPKTI